MGETLHALCVAYKNEVFDFKGEKPVGQSRFFSKHQKGSYHLRLEELCHYYSNATLDCSIYSTPTIIVCIDRSVNRMTVLITHLNCVVLKNEHLIVNKHQTLQLWPRKFGARERAGFSSSSLPAYVMTRCTACSEH